VAGDCAAGTPIACASVNPDDRQEFAALDLPAGDYYVWFGSGSGGGFQGAQVLIEEYEPASGESCGSAVELAQGTTTPMSHPASTLRTAEPSCIPAGDLVWYAHVMTGANNQLTITADADDPIALYDRATGHALGCWDDTTAGVSRLVGEGSSLCIALPAATTIDSITLTQVQVANCAVALISDDNQLNQIEPVLDTLGGTVQYTRHNTNTSNMYTEDGPFLASHDVIIWYTQRRAISAAEESAMEAWLQGGGRLLVTGHDSLGAPTNIRLANLVRSTSRGDGPFTEQFTITDGSHPITNGAHGSWTNGTIMTAGYLDHDQAEADTSAGAVTLAELNGSTSDKLMVTDSIGVGNGSVVYWNGNLNCIDWTSGGTQPDMQHMFLNAVDYLCWY